MQGMKQKCLVLSASTYQITDEKTGEIKSGLTIFYITIDDLSPKDDPMARERGQISLGLQPSKESLPITKREKIVTAPALYDITFQMVTRQLKTQVKPVDIDFISEAVLSPKKA